VLQGRLVRRLCVAALIGSSLALLPILPHLLGEELILPPQLTDTDEAEGFGLASLRSAVKANEGEHADESMIGNVPWQPLPLIVVIGFVTGSGVYLVMSHKKRKG
jgi:hypothetical protein